MLLGSLPRRRRFAVAFAIGIAAAGSVAAAAHVGRHDDATARPTPAPERFASMARPPERLADTGLYRDITTREIAADVLPYSPQYPLWSDGATKRRWIHLPAGAAIDGADADAWRFPVGTKLWKEFAFGHTAETRYFEQTASGWIFGTYVWSTDGRDAVLASDRGVRGVAEIRPGVRHDIPSRADCMACHGGRNVPILGFSALQLSPDRDPLAPHAETPSANSIDLESLVARGLIAHVDPAIVSRPPRIDAPTPRARAALGYLHANCSSCHAAGGGLADLGLHLDVRLGGARADARPALSTTLGVASRFRVGAAGHEAVARIVPGDPDRSVLWRRIASRDPRVQMPPLGTRVVDDEAVALVESWIRDDLPVAPPPASSDFASSSPHPKE
jgi:hypothetical protein